MGITLVVLLLLQMLSVLILWDWGSEPFRQLVVERLIAQAPMALVGLLLMYLSSRVEDSSAAEARTPILWTICIISALLATLLTASLPIAFGGDQLLQEQTDQQLAAQRAQLEMARQQSQNPEVLQQLVRQAEAAGQIPAGASAAQKTQAARAFIERQLDTMQNKFTQSEQSAKVANSQRRFGNSGGAIALIVAFTILSLGSVL
jgi:multidrug efflux pump subunit AcrA (membrane-fusion protein)